MLFRSSLFELVASLGLVSQIVLLVLFIFSVVSWTLILYKWRFFRRQASADQHFLRGFPKIADPLDGIRTVERHKGSSLAAVYAEVARCYQVAGNGGGGGHREVTTASGVSPLPTQHYVERVLNHAVQAQITSNETYLPFLATTANVSPFVGLLGTVLGIIAAFRDIGIQGTASLATVAPGVAEALIATAAGLFTAIPAVVAYNYFLSRVREQAARMERFGIDWMNMLERQRQQETARQL